MKFNFYNIINHNNTDNLSDGKFHVTLINLEEKKIKLHAIHVFSNTINGSEEIRLKFHLYKNNNDNDNDDNNDKIFQTTHLERKIEKK